MSRTEQHASNVNSVPALKRRSPPSLITVGVPVFNAQSSIDRTLASIKSQTWVGAIEILVVDDGSTDGTPELLQRVADQDARIRILRHDKNLGRPYARNTILQHARGDFLTWLDADDEWYPEKLARQVETLAVVRSDLGDDVITMCAFDWKWTGKQSRVVVPKITTDNLRDILSDDLGAYLWSMLGPIDAFRNTGTFDVNLPRLQDLDFLIRFTARGGRLVPTIYKGPLCIYNKTDENRSGQSVADALDHVWRKHKVLFLRYGKVFAARARKRHFKLVARFSFANNERRRGYLYAAKARLADAERLAFRTLLMR
jgi:glycosyltransferase involved in cell wall biosynthesis